LICLDTKDWLVQQMQMASTQIVIDSSFTHQADNNPHPFSVIL